MSPSTPPSHGGTGQQTQASMQATSALAFAEQLQDYVAGLIKELRGYGDPNTVGRDTSRLQVFFSDIHRCEIQVAQAMGINWKPQNWST